VARRDALRITSAAQRRPGGLGRPPAGSHFPLPRGVRHARRCAEASPARAFLPRKRELRSYGYHLSDL